MSHSSAVINAGFYTLQSSKGTKSRNTVISQYYLDEKDIFQRMFPIIPKVSQIVSDLDTTSYIFSRIALSKLMIHQSQELKNYLN